MSPLSHSDRHDAPWLADDVVPGEAAVVDDLVIEFEGTVREPVITNELPHVFSRVEFGASRQMRQKGDSWWHSEFVGIVPSSLIKIATAWAPEATWKAVS